MELWLAHISELKNFRVFFFLLISGHAPASFEKITFSFFSVQKKKGKFWETRFQRMEAAAD